MSATFLQRVWISIALILLVGVLFYIANVPASWLFVRATPLSGPPTRDQNPETVPKRVLRVGGDQNYPPYAFLSNGQPTGFDIEMIRSTAQAVGMDVEIHLGPWNEMREALEQKKIDVVAGMAYSEERDQVFDFTTPHAVITFDLFVPNGSSIHNLDQLRGRQVIVQQGGLMEDYLRENEITDRLVPVPSPSDALLLLSTGTYDCAALNKVQGLYFLEQLNIHNVHPVSADFLIQKYAFAVAEGDHETLLQLNQGLNLIKASGAYQSIYDTWFGVYENNYFFPILRYLLTGLAAAVFLLAISLIWTGSLQSRVEQRTQALRASEEQLRRSEERFRTLFEEAPLSYQLLDPEGAILNVNTTWLQTLAYPIEEVQGKPFAYFLGASSTALFESIFERFKTEGVIQGVELELRRKNGNALIACFEGRVSYAEDGQIRQLHCIFRDVTEQHRAQEAVRLLEDRFEKIFRDSPDVITITRIHDGVLLDVNNTFLQYTGYQRQDVIGKTTMEIGTWSKEEERTAWVQEVLKNGKVDSKEFNFLQKDGSTVTALLSARLIEFQGEPCALSTARDITERKQAEEKIQQQMEYLASMRAIDQAITSSAGLDETLQVLLEQMLTRLQVDSACLLLYNPLTQGLEYGASRGSCICLLGNSRMKLGEGLAGQAAQSGRMVMLTGACRADGLSLCEQSMYRNGIQAYYALPLITKNGLQGVLEILHRSPLTPDAGWMSFFEALAGQAAIAIENATLLRDLQQANQRLALSYDRTIEGWAQALELRDIETRGHSRRVADLIELMSTCMGIEGEELVHIRRGALMHDVGKMGIPDSILFKPGMLTTEEMEIMKKHVDYGYQMLSQIDFIREALDIPYCHHERWDGTGYPRGLKGEAIPLSARMFAIVDVWDALRSDRPYRKAWSREKVVMYLQEQSGKHFDPHIVEIFLSIFHDPCNPTDIF